MEKKQYTSPIAEEFAYEMRRQARKAKIINYAPLGVLVFFFALLSAIAPGFLSLYNLRTILNQLSVPLVMTMGLTFVILLGCTDLSGEGLGGFCGCLVTLLVINTKNANDFGAPAFLIAICCGLAVGLCSGFIHVKGKIPSFMVTYAISSIMAGFAVMSYRGQPAMAKDPLLTRITSGSVLGVPYLTVVSLLVFAAAFFLQNYTRFGAYVMAIGDNEAVARNTGVNVDRIKMKVFIWAGFCVGVSGVISAIRVARGDVGLGRDTVFPAITAVVVGGTTLTGGKGGVVNSLVGALIVTIINNGLILMGVNMYIRSALQGVIIIIAVALSVNRGKKVVVK
jgi:ribose transport system permease protein